MSARLLLIAAAVLFSTGGAAIKGTLLNSWQIAALRSLIAAIAVAAILPEVRRGWRWRYVPVAAAYAATLMLFIAATKLTTAANAIFLQGAAPLFVLLLGPLLLKEPVRRSDVVLMLVVACGMGMFFAGHEGARATAPDPARGNLFGAASSFTWALTIIGLRWLGRSAARSTDPGMITVLIGNLLASAAAMPFAFPFPAFQWRDRAIVIWLGVFQIALAYLCLTRGIRSVPVMEATILLLLEPALNPVWAWLIHGETPAPLSLAGGAIIFLAVFVKGWWQSRRPTILKA